jgi:hypothetical protein
MHYQWLGQGGTPLAKRFIDAGTRPSIPAIEGLEEAG